jgi:alkylated DNA repair protein (DNA oxidative demethylase)
MQQNLFPMEGAPDGLFFETEILTPDEERAYLTVIRNLPFGPFRMHGVDAKRRVVRYGEHYVSGSAEMKPPSAFPASLEPLRERAAAVTSVPVAALSETLVTEYTPGAGIGWHRDSSPFGIIVGISFGAQCRMRFQRGEGIDHQTWSIELPSRSLYMLSGTVREDWQHCIPPVKEARYSVTFRTLGDRAANESIAQFPSAKP